jgi:hypothetical protein
MKSSLHPGIYMRTSSVISWLDANLPAHKYVEQIMDVCPIYQGSESNYFSTEDLKSIIKSDMFKEMECDCITYIIEN